MGNQARFYNWSNELPPLNRRIYTAAKAPFAYLRDIAIWAVRPWLTAAPFGFLAAALVGFMANQAITPNMLIDVVQVGLVWTVYLGGAIAIFKILKGFFN